MNMLIDGKWVDASNGECMDIRNPGTGEVIDRVPRLGSRTAYAKQFLRDRLLQAKSNEEFLVSMNGS